MRSPRLRSRSTTFTVPSTAGPSSSEVIKSAIDPLCEECLARKSSTATTKAAIEVFMSAAPRPNSLPSRSVGTKGSLFHWSSGPVEERPQWKSDPFVPTEREGVALPLVERAGGDDVGVAHKTDERSGTAAARPEVRDLAAPDRLDLEAQPREALAQQGLAAFVLRGDRAACDQLAREPEGRGCFSRHDAGS